MVRALTQFLRVLPVRLRAIWALVNDPALSQTYYPDEERKSKRRILLDNLWWLLRYQEVNRYYYAYGLDRKRGLDRREFLSYADFRKMRDQANASRAGGYSRGRKISYRFLTGDKFVFGQYLTALGFPTPRILAIGDNESITWLEGAERLPLDSLLRRELDSFLKGVMTDGAECVLPLTVSGGRVFVSAEEQTLDQLRATIRGRYLIQERVEQHPKMSELYPHSVNTIRLVTVVVDGQPRPFSAVVRIGAGGGRCDNWMIGGLACGVDLETGLMGRYGLFKPGYGTRVGRHPDTGTVFEGFQIPFFLDAARMATELHRFFCGFHSLGWDIAITENGPVFLEANDDWELGFHQAHYGGLKKRFTETLPAG